MKQISVKIDEDDLNLLMADCREIFIHAYPNEEGKKHSIRFMLHRVIKYYIEN